MSDEKQIALPTISIEPIPGTATRIAKCSECTWFDLGFEMKLTTTGDAHVLDHLAKAAS